MFETLRHYPFLVLNQMARDPLDALAALRENLYSHIEAANTIDYVADPEWETALHRGLEISSDTVLEGFWPLWSTVVAGLRAQGVAVGPFSFHAWNDGDAGLVRAIWCLIRHLRPANVIETGVAHGMTSRFILEALESNGAGRLWSIDLPPVNPRTRQEVGIAVRQPGGPVERWTYIAGTSRRRLPVLLARLGQVDLFIHDSMHSNRNVMFELDCAWDYLAPGGVMVVDDIDANPAFDSFVREHPDHPSFVCTAEPLGPDMRRFNQK
ncbi:MAG TPA: class I SAM-dependent methyltransferase, partial [Rhodopila sp.]